MDLKNILKEEEEEVSSTKDIRVHKKPMQLRDIENRSSSRKIGGNTFETQETMKELINEEKKNSYKKSWNKLDLGLKINRLKNFIEKESIEKELSEKQKEELSSVLLNGCRSNKLNKNSDINYNIEQGEIIGIKALYYTPKIGLRLNEVKKSKHGNKSKSNIDRFIKTKK